MRNYQQFNNRTHIGNLVFIHIFNEWFVWFKFLPQKYLSWDKVTISRRLACFTHVSTFYCTQKLVYISAYKENNDFYWWKTVNTVMTFNIKTLKKWICWCTPISWTKLQYPNVQKRRVGDVYASGYAPLKNNSFIG